MDTLDDFGGTALSTINSISKGLSGLQIPHVVLDYRAVEASLGSQTITSSAPRSAFSRSVFNNPRFSDCYVVNDSVARVVCRDKYAIYEILAHQSLETAELPHTVLCDADFVESLLEDERFGGDPYVILKPRYGAFSKDIFRLKKTDVSVFSGRETGEDFLLRRWIEPMKLRWQDGRLRAFSICSSAD